MATLEELALSYQKGNTEAIDEIIERCSYIVRNMSRRYFLMGGENEDLYQEGFMGLIKAAKTYRADGGSPFKSYAFLCVQSSVITAVKKYAGNKNKVLNDGLPLSEALSEATDDPEELVIQGENRQEFLSGIEKKLSAFERQVLSMYLSGMSYREMEEQTGRELKQIDNALQRIRNKIKKLIGVTSPTTNSF